MGTRCLPKSPYMLTMPEKMLYEMIHNLSSLMPGPELGHLIDKNPDIQIHPWRDTAKKIFYIDEEMGLDQPHFAFNSTLSHPFIHVRNRHQLLKRMGKYSMPKLHKDRLSYLQNPKLEKIMDSKEEAFLKHVAEISEEEWYVFEQMMAEEYGETLDGIPLDMMTEEEKEEEAEENDRFFHHGDTKKKPKHLKGYSMKPKTWETY